MKVRGRRWVIGKVEDARGEGKGLSGRDGVRDVERAEGIYSSLWKRQC